MKLIKEYINEKFTEDSDPIDDLGIGMMHKIKKWIESIGKKFIDKDNALIKCAEYGKIEFVKYLLNAGANVHAQNDDALRWASANGHVEVVKLLLDAGADVHADDDAALRWASRYGHTEVIKLLLDVGADVHANEDASLRNASYHGHTEVIKLLLDAGADVHAENDYALRYASYHGHTEVVKLLLDAGADVHAENDYALRYASLNGHAKVVKILKDHIAKEKKLKKRIKESLNERFTEDSDPVEDLGIGMMPQIKKFLKTIYESTVESDYLWMCAKYRKKEFVEYLLYKSKDNPLFLVHIDYALKKAVINNDLEIVNLLLNTGVSIYSPFFKEAKSYAEHYEYNDIYNILKRYINKNKKIKESLNEKFTEDSDPVSDMGIGMFQRSINFTNKKDFYEWLLYVIPLILNTNSIPEDILKSKNDAALKFSLFHEIYSYIKKYEITFEGLKPNDPACKIYFWPHELRKILIEKGFETS